MFQWFPLFRKPEWTSKIGTVVSFYKCQRKGCCHLNLCFLFLLLPRSTRKCGFFFPFSVNKLTDPLKKIMKNMPKEF